MRLILLLFALGGQAAGYASVPNNEGPGASYQSTKSLPQLQKCLTNKLARIGDVNDITVDGITTLMVREGPNDQAMLIDLAPPKVTVTTKFLYGTRKIVEGCL
jgi:hypothetical protein